MSSEQIFSKGKLREILEDARKAGMVALVKNDTTPLNDDQDCYPRAIYLTIDKTRPELRIIKELEKEFSWLKINRKSMTITISAPISLKFRLQELAYKEAIAASLRSNGIECYVEVGWH
jgi:hypothetical protein